MCAEDSEFEFLDLVGFKNVALSVESVIVYQYWQELLR